MKKVGKWFLIVLGSVILLLFVFVIFGTSRFAEIQEETFVSNAKSPTLKPTQKIKILSWNVQYMAGKDYVFFYDLLDGSGPDARPSREAIDKTLKEVAAIITEENPDMILLQEVDEGASRTDYEDQLDRLLKYLPKDYQNYSSSWYWKAEFVPHPKVLGKAGMKLSVISKYKIKKAIRHQLDLIETENWLMQQFNLKRAIQEVVFEVENGKDLSIFNTHLSAFAQGSKNMENQVNETKAILDDRTKAGFSWLIGGDFNLLASEKAFQSLPKDKQAYYNPISEITPLLIYPLVPSLEAIDGENRKEWFTHFPNDPKVKAPDRTIDYIFYAPSFKLGEHKVLQGNTWKISDHLPIVATFQLP